MIGATDGATEGKTALSRGRGEACTMVWDLLLAAKLAYEMPPEGCPSESTYCKLNLECTRENIGDSWDCERPSFPTLCSTFHLFVWRR
eukprot:g9193.t1